MMHAPHMFRISLSSMFSMTVSLLLGWLGSIGYFVWSTNTGCEGTSSCLGSRAGCVAGIAVTSRVLDCSCVEAPGPGCAHGRAGKERGFSRNVLILLWPEEQLLRSNNLTQSYMHSSPTCLGRLSWPPACRESDKRPWPNLLLLLPSQAQFQPRIEGGEEASGGKTGS